MTLAIALICGAILLGAAVASALRYVSGVVDSIGRAIEEYGRG